MHQIFYLTLDPERALGIEDLLHSYHILYLEPSQLAIPISNRGVDIKNFTKSAEIKAFNTETLLEDPKVLDYIKKNAYNKPNILVFKNFQKIEQKCEELGFNLLNASADVSKKYENKIEFAKFLDQLDIFDKPKYQLFEKLSDLKYTDVQREFGNDFIIQFYFGHTGNSTFFIHSEQELIDLQTKLPLRKGKVVQLIKGIPYTINACITKLGIVIGGISEQITGIGFLTHVKGSTVGNDFTQRHFNDDIRRDLIERTMKFGEILEKEGHRGIFGLDLILEEGTNKLYVIEANVRQTMSCSYVSYLQRDQQQVPILLWHMLELLNHDYGEDFLTLAEETEEFIKNGLKNFRDSADKVSYNISMNQPVEASQVFFRNKKNHAVKILDPFPAGIYRIRGRLPNEAAELEHDHGYPAIYKMREDGFNHLCLVGRGYNILEAKEEGGFMLYCAPENAIVPELGEIGRIQVNESAFSSPTSNDLSGWIKDTVNVVYENIRLIDVQ